MSSRASFIFSLLLLTAAAVLSGTLLNMLLKNPENFRWDLSAGSITSLHKETILALGQLKEPVKLTYYTTEKKIMPTPLRRTEDEVRALLREMQRHGGKNFSYTVTYPEDAPQVTRTLGRFKLTPFQYKTILRDEYSVSTVWSGILIEYKGQTRSIPYILPEHLGHLEERIITRIGQIDSGYKPVCALSAGTGSYERMKGLVKEQNYSEILKFDLARDREIPPTADCAFIFQPENLPARASAAIQSFLDDGKDVYLCFSPYAVSPDVGGYRLTPKKSGLEEYLAARGITEEPKVLLDRKKPFDGSFFLKIMESQCNFTGFVLQRGGELFLPNVSPFTFDQEKLKQHSLTCTALMYTSNEGWTIPFGNKGKFLQPADFQPPRDGNFKIETAGAMIAGENPWQGKLFLFGSGAFFGDEALSRGGGHVYIKNLLMTFEKPENQSSLRVGRIAQPLLREIGGRERIFWRIIGIFLIPAFLIILMAARTLTINELLRPLRSRNTGIVMIFVAGIAVIWASAMVLRPLGRISPDISRQKSGAVDPVAVEWLQHWGGKALVRYYTSPSADMPLNARDIEEKVYTRLKAMAEVSRGTLEVRREEITADKIAASPELQKTLDRYGVKPFKMKMITDDKYVEKLVYSGLVFEKDGNVEAVPQLTRQNAQRIEFLVLAALKRLKDQKKPRIALVADMPHLSAGEFWELQQLEAKTLPRSEDVYASLLHLLRNEGYTVSLYDSKAKDLHFTDDLLIYLQPWVVEKEMHKEFNRYLRAGGTVILGAQHFNMQLRKYSGKAYAASYWPGPQFLRINELLEPYGIELVREVFFDQSKASIETEEQLRWGAYKKFDRKAPDARSFIIRAIPANYDKKSSITSRLSDILFIWGNRWQTIKENFPSTLTWKPLILSSPDSWSLDWKGGFLSDEILQGGDYFDVGQPLAVMVEGKFPALGDGKPSEKTGRLLLIGSSKIFANDQIDNDRYDDEKFILNSVADLVYGSEFAQAQSHGGSTVKGFGFVPPGKKLLWRAFAIAFAPFLFILYGLFRRLKR